METPRRIPLQDLPLEQFLTPGIISTSKTPRNHKRPLSPSRTTPFNPAKRRVLDAEGISLSNNVVKSSPAHPVPFMLSNMHTVTPTRLSRLGDGYNSLSYSCTVSLNVVLGSFEIMGAPKDRRPTSVRLLANFTLSQQSNHPPTRSQGTILGLPSSETTNIAGAPWLPEWPCHLMAMPRLIDPRRTRRTCRSGGRRRNLVQRNVFCLASMGRMHRVSAHLCRRVGLFILNEHLFLHAKLYDNPSWVFPPLRVFLGGRAQSR